MIPEFVIVASRSLATAEILHIIT